MPDATQEPVTPMTPRQVLDTYTGAPSEDQIQAWKSSAPNRRIKLFRPDENRVYIIRGITALEMRTIANSLNPNSADKSTDEAIALAAKCVLWTNAGTEHNKLDEMLLRAGAAGTAFSIHQIVLELSDFFDSPTIFGHLSADL